MQTVYIIAFLILFPFLIAMGSLVTPPGVLRRIVLAVANLIIVAGTVLLVTQAGEGPQFFSIRIPIIEHLVSGALVVLALLITYLGMKARRYLTFLLGLVLTGLSVAFEFAVPAPVAEHELFIDRFSILMALVVGILGPLIIYYAIGYLAEQQKQHPERRDRRRWFGFLIYLFTTAMFGLIFSNSLRWLLFFWEITTLCSFFLIKYKEDEESQDAAFRALWMNVIGGIAFSSGIFYLSRTAGIAELDRMVAAGTPDLLLPAVFFAFAGVVKSAQMPFSTWLTKAMAAPTPVSALLHSSTMVKAGVYLLLRASPILNDTVAGVSLTFLGAVTFLFSSLIAVSQTDAKRVLAYSTISTLGLIVMCAGVGTYEAAWSALLLILFHGVAKSLLFLCVGIIDLRLGSRDIEDMDFLVMKMPRLSFMLNIGLAGMFLAPFGMVISKAVTLRALVDTHPLLGVILAFGSGATLFFYAKWMGKSLMVRSGEANREGNVSYWEWLAITILSVLTVAVCLLFPVITDRLVDPYVLETYGLPTTVEPFNLIMIVIIMASLLVIFPLGFLYSFIRKPYRFVGAYLSGLDADKSIYVGAGGQLLHADTRNYYLTHLFGESHLLPAGLLTAGFCLIVMFGVVVL